jgi:hypothetical protein
MATTAAHSALDLLHAPLLLYTDDAANTTDPADGHATDLTHRYFLALTIIMYVDQNSQHSRCW